MTPTILVVDDDRTALDLFVLILTEEPGWIVRSASSVAEAQTIAQRERPSLIISDMHIKGEDGREFCRNVRANPELRDVLFLFLSGSGETEAHVSARQAGADGYLTKPIHPERLLIRVRWLLRFAGRRVELSRESEKFTAEQKPLGPDRGGLPGG